MNLQELRRIREKERSTDSLQELREDFYTEVAAYLDELTSRRDGVAAEADDPFADPEVRRISDELAAAERTAEAIYERRVGKVVKLASFSAAEMAADQDGLTAEERELFEGMVELIQSNRERVLERLTAERDGDAVGGRPESEEDPARRGEPDAVDEPADAEAAEPDGTAGDQPTAGNEDEVERTTVRITSDVGEIVGVDDRAYDLAVDDVVSLPTKNATPLVQRDAAEPIE